MSRSPTRSVLVTGQPSDPFKVSIALNCVFFNDHGIRVAAPGLVNSFLQLCNTLHPVAIVLEVFFQHTALGCMSERRLSRYRLHL